MSKFILASLLAACLLGGCVQFKSNRGVEVAWGGAVVENFAVGETTRAEVLKELGPPSQIISLEEETVLYYLFEKQEGSGALLIVYNTFEIEARYDRAVFFFDKNDRLTDFSSRVHAHDGGEAGE